MPPLLGVLAQTGPHGPMGPHGPTGGEWAGGWMGGGPLPWFGPWGGLLAVSIVVGLLVAVVYGTLVLAQRDAATGTTTEDEALAVLARRYARGEVDDEEDDERRRRLTD